MSGGWKVQGAPAELVLGPREGQASTSQRNRGPGPLPFFFSAPRQGPKKTQAHCGRYLWTKNTGTLIGVKNSLAMECGFRKTNLSRTLQSAERTTGQNVQNLKRGPSQQISP